MRAAQLGPHGQARHFFVRVAGFVAQRHRVQEHAGDQGAGVDPPALLEQAARQVDGQRADGKRRSPHQRQHQADAIEFEQGTQAVQAAEIVVFHALVDGQFGAAVQGPQAAEQTAQQHADDDVGHEHRVFVDVGRADAQRGVGGRVQVQAGLFAFCRRIAVAHVIGAADIHDVLAQCIRRHAGLAIDQLDARARGVQEWRRHGGRVKRRRDGVLFGRILRVAVDHGFERPARQFLFTVRAPRQLAHAAGQRQPFLLLGQCGRHRLLLLLLVGAMRQLEGHGRQHGAFQLDARDGAHALADPRAGEVNAGRAARAYPRQVRVLVRLFGQDQHQLPAIRGQLVEQAVQRPLARLVLFIHGWRQVQVDGQHLAAARGGAGEQLLQA